MESTGLDIQKKQMEVESQKKMVELLQKRAAGGGFAVDPGAAMFEMANDAAISGNPQLAESLIAKGAAVEKNLATARESIAKDRIRKLNTLASATKGIPLDAPDDVGQQALDAAKLFIQSANIEIPENAQQLMKLPYKELRDSGMLARLQEGVATRLQDAQQDAATARAERDRSQVKKDEVTKRLEETKIRLTNKRIWALGKAGGEKVPSGADLQDATDLISEDFVVPTDDKHKARAAGREIVANARKLTRTNPNITLQEAIHQEYITERNAGRFAGWEKVISQSGSRENPMSLPMVDGKIDQGRMVANRVYWGNPGNNKFAGQMWQWDAKKQKLIALAGGAPEEPGVVDDDGLVDEDDE